MKQKLFVIAALILLQAPISIPSISAQQPNAPYRSYQQARRVLDDAIAASIGEFGRAFTTGEPQLYMQRFKDRKR